MRRRQKRRLPAWVQKEVLRMTDQILEKINSHLKWLNSEIAFCEENGFESHPQGKVYLESLKASRTQFEKLNKT
jgi:hypothetical protein